MQFQVPQFLDVEDKVIGPLTIKQFLFIAGGVGIGYLLYVFLPAGFGILLGILMGGFGFALAYVKFNNKPLIFLIQSAFYYLVSDRMYIWKRKEKVAESALNLNNFKPVKRKSGASMKTVSSKLSDLSWSMDIKEQPESIEDQKRMDALGL